MIEVSSRRCSGRWRRYPMRTWPRPIGPLMARPGRRRAHGCAPRDSGEVQARLKPEQTAKINMPRRATDGPGKHRPLKGPSRPSGSRTTRCTPVGTGPTAAHRQHPGPGDFHEASAGCSCTARPCTANRIPSSKLSRSSPALTLDDLHERWPKPIPGLCADEDVGSPPTLTPPLCHGLSVRTRAAP